MNIIKRQLLTLLLVPQISLAAQLQDVKAIENAVSSYVQSSLDTNGRYQINVTPLDMHLQLPFCDENLDVSPQAAEVKAGHNTLLVQCKGSQPWKIYSSVIVKSYKEVLVLVRPLQRNAVIHAEDIVRENREISALSQGYLLDPLDVVNKQAARNLQIGTVLNGRSYQDLTLIKRGDRVTIQLGKSGMSISMAGIAMMNGAKGDRINVKNTSSQKLIQAMVVDAAKVSVNF
ncbi:flagellar basal body P-ring formation chaperone FlgA [Methylomonas sp. AM2-LC]|uniref:flagellar basal body P-ring formation chaperone FlgA n=1 Tax=Methylomonas sp. AM2-LC TaxID=3153301 RepID=UPI0032636607